jgi:multiple sugar transport system substrate-binding protein
MRYSRLVSGLTVAIVLSLSLAGPAAAQGTGWSVPTRPITLTYWDSADNVKNELLSKKLIPEYQKLRPNVTIRYEVIAGLAPKMLVALSTGTAPELFEVADFLLPIVLESNVLDPLPPEAWGQTSVEGVVNTYLPRLLDTMTRRGKLYAVPDQMNAHSLYINNRLFREAGLDPVKDAPKTWDDVAKLNKVLTKRKDGRVVQKGWEMRYAAEHWPSRMFHILTYQAGGDVIRDGKPAFNGEAGLRALGVWKSVSVAPQVTQNTAASPYMDFAMEQDAMTFAGPNGGASIEKVNPQMKGNYTVARLPAIQADRPATVAYSYNWAVNAKAPDDAKRVAWDFIRFASTRPAEWMATAKYLQPVKGWYETPAARQTPFLDVFIHDLSVGRPMAQTHHYAELQSALARMIDRVILNNADPKRALDQAAEEYTRAAAK